MKLLSSVRPSAIPWTAAYQVPASHLGQPGSPWSPEMLVKECREHWAGSQHGDLSELPRVPLSTSSVRYGRLACLRSGQPKARGLVPRAPRGPSRARPVLGTEACTKNCFFGTFSSEVSHISRNTNIIPLVNRLGNTVKCFLYNIIISINWSKC